MGINHEWIGLPIMKIKTGVIYVLVSTLLLSFGPHCRLVLKFVPPGVCTTSPFNPQELGFHQFLHQNLWVKHQRMSINRYKQERRGIR